MPLFVARLPAIKTLQELLQFISLVSPTENQDKTVPISIGDALCVRTHFRGASRASSKVNTAGALKRG